MAQFSVCMFFPRNEKEQNQWDYVLSPWCPATVYLVGEGTLPHLNNIFKDAIQVETLTELPEDEQIILMAPQTGRFIQGDESLYDFVHPENAIYMFGPNHVNLTLEDDFWDGRMPDHRVYVTVDTNDEMFNWIAGTVTLYDRRLKSNG